MPDFSSGLFGSPAGMRIGEEQNQQTMLHLLAAQEGQQRIQQNAQMNPLVIQHQQMTNQQQQIKMQRDQAMVDALKRVDNGEPFDPIAATQKIGDAAMQAGNYDEAMKAYRIVEDQKRRQALTNLSQARTVNENLKADHGALTVMGMLLNGVSDEGSWRRAVNTYEQSIGKQTEYHDQPYDPAVVENLKKQALTAKQSIDIAARDNENQSKEANRQSAMDFRAFRENLMTQEQRIRERREQRLEKAGGKAATSPVQTEVDQATRLIVGDKPDAKDAPTELGTAAYAVASRAKILRRDNPALDPDEALRRSWDELKGNYSVISRPGAKLFGYEIPGTKPADEQKFLRGAGSMQQPLDIGSVKSEKELSVGKFYKNAKGQIGQWDGKQIVPVQAGSARVEPLPIDEADEEEPD